MIRLLPVLLGASPERRDTVSFCLCSGYGIGCQSQSNRKFCLKTLLVIHFASTVFLLREAKMIIILEIMMSLHKEVTTFLSVSLNSILN